MAPVLRTIAKATKGKTVDPNDSTITEISSPARRSGRLRKANPKYCSDNTEEGTQHSSDAPPMKTTFKNSGNTKVLQNHPTDTISLPKPVHRTSRKTAGGIRKAERNGKRKDTTFGNPSSNETLKSMQTTPKREAARTNIEKTDIKEKLHDNASIEWDSDDDFVTIEQLCTPPKRSCGTGRAPSTPNKTRPIQDTLENAMIGKDSLQEPREHGEWKNTQQKSPNKQEGDKGKQTLLSSDKQSLESTMTDSNSATTTTPTTGDMEKQDLTNDNLRGKEDNGDELSTSKLPLLRTKTLQFQNINVPNEIKHFEKGNTSCEQEKTNIKDAHPNLIDPVFRGRITGKWVDYLFGPRFDKKMMVTILDEENDEIQCLLEDINLDKWNECLELGGVYDIKNTTIVQSRRKNRLTPHIFSMNILSSSVFTKIIDDHSIPLQRFYIKPLNEIEEAFASSEFLVDVLGAIARCEPCRQITTVNGITNISAVYLADQSNKVMKITLWGEFAASYSELLSEGNISHRPILVTKLKVENFRGVYSLSTTHYSTILLNPAEVLPETSICLDIPNIQSNMEQIIHSKKRCKTDDQMTMADLIAKTDGVIQEKTLFVIAGSISTFHLSEGIYYRACHSCFCQYQPMPGSSACNKCKITVTKEIRRPRIKLQAEDDTGKVDITLFGSDAELAMGVPLSKLVSPSGKEGNMAELNEILKVRLDKKFIFNITVTPKNSYFAKRRSFTANSIVEA